VQDNFVDRKIQSISPPLETGNSIWWCNLKYVLIRSPMNLHREYHQQVQFIISKRQGDSTQN
ncbi:hypothetical protein MKW98_023000, partial [Papaver atlanticum]